MAAIQYLADDGINFINVSEADPLPVAGGGGGPTGPVEVEGIGVPSASPWTGSGDGEMIAILKGIYLELQQVATDTNELTQDIMVTNSLLNDIKTNTAVG